MADCAGFGGCFGGVGGERVDVAMNTSPKIRFIKLGETGKWEASCLEEGTIRLGYGSPHHGDSLAGRWDVVRDFWLDRRDGDSGAATRDVNQIRDFYELGEGDLWITFHKRKLYWCHASALVQELADGSRVRKALGTGWTSADPNGNALRIENLDGRLTQVQGFRGTICKVGQESYLLRKMRGQASPEIETARAALDVLHIHVRELIKGLWWHDFELLIDLLFARAGWQRFSVVGKTEKDIDLDVYSPTTKKRAFVQVKSHATKDEILACVESFVGYDQYQEMYFVFHTCGAGVDDLLIDDARVYLWNIDRISALTISSGLTEWLINKRS